MSYNVAQRLGRLKAYEETGSVSVANSLKIRISRIILVGHANLRRQMTIINASEFQKRLGEFSSIARREPVTITRHGRPTLVLLAAEDYERLRRFEERSTRAVRTVDLPRGTIEAMKNAELSHLPED